ncbi:MAG: hypothetical protein QM811_18455 [Pirellulales bacterium]
MWIDEASPWMTDARVCELLDRVVARCVAEWPRKSGRVLLVLPERMRLLSGLGPFACHIVQALQNAFGDVRVLIAESPGAAPFSPAERSAVFPELSGETFVGRSERSDVISRGTIPADVVMSCSGGLSAEAIPLSLPRSVVEAAFDGVVSLEQVVPDDLFGFTGPPVARWSAAGTAETFAAFGALAGATGAENATANLSPPLRQCLLWADARCWPATPRVDVALVRGVDLHGHPAIVGFYSGTDEQTYFQAALLSRRTNVVALETGAPRIVVMADGERFGSVWDLMRITPRVRMAVADMGEIVLIAPGLKHVAHDPNDAALIAKLGYSSTADLLERRADVPELAARSWLETHLRHGSSEGRCRMLCATDDFDEALLALYLHPWNSATRCIAIVRKPRNRAGTSRPKAKSSTSYPIP